MNIANLVNSFVSNNKQLQTALKSNREKITLPFINKASFKKTLDNYDNFVEEYNKKVRKENNKIEEYNKDKRKIPPYFLYKHFDIFTANDKVRELNEYGTVYKLRKLHTIKYASKRIFEQILKEAGKQLIIEYKAHVTSGLTYATKKEEITTQISRGSIAEALGISEKTAYNHIRRFIEAGILYDYKFHGNNKAIEVKINPEILVLANEIRGDNEEKNTIEFQPVATERKNLPLKKNIQEQKNKERNKDTKNLCQKKENSCDANASTGTNDKNTARHYATSLNLLKMILPALMLARRIFEGLYENYTPISKLTLKKEVLYGTLTREEFRELLLQEFLKTASKLWKDWKFGKIYKAEWLKTYKILKTSYLITNAGKLPYKQSMLEKHYEYIWRLKQVRNYKNMHPDWNLPAPSKFFNPYMTGGFKETRKFWLKHLEKEKNREKIIKEIKRNARIKENERKLNKAFKYRLEKYKKGEMPLYQLKHWVRTFYPGAMDKITEA